MSTGGQIKNKGVPDDDSGRVSATVVDVDAVIRSTVCVILQNLLDDPYFMHGAADRREEKIRHIAKTHGVTLAP